MSENDLLKCVLNLAKLYGWRTYHARPAMTAKGYRTPVQGDGKGFPDLVLAKQGRVIFAELKSAKGTLTDAQQEWRGVLYQYAHVWRPTDWNDGTILATLKGTPP